MNNYDVIIIGGGAAGMSALLWCHSLALRGLMLERSAEPGGQMLQMFHRVSDYPGLPGLTGREMRDRFLEHLHELRLEWRSGCRIDEFDLPSRSLVCDGESFKARGLIIATGARKRSLDVPGEERLSTRGVSFSATRDHSLYAGRRVCVIGGGDSAIENCLILSRVCPQVTLIHRSDRFRAREDWLAAARSTSNIRFLPHHDVVSIEGQESVERIIVRERESGSLHDLETDAVFVKIGIAPNTEQFAGRIGLDEAGYVVVDRRLRTSVDWVYAIGDVTAPVCLSVATAVGHGAIAIKDLKERIEGR